MTLDLLLKVVTVSIRTVEIVKKTCQKLACNVAVGNVWISTCNRECYPSTLPGAGDISTVHASISSANWPSIRAARCCKSAMSSFIPFCPVRISPASRTPTAIMLILMLATSVSLFVTTSFIYQMYCESSRSLNKNKSSFLSIKHCGTLGFLRANMSLDIGNFLLKCYKRFAPE